MDTKIEITLQINDPGNEGDPYSDEQIIAWLRYRLHDTFSIAADNPLCDHELGTIPGTMRIRRNQRLIH